MTDVPVVVLVIEDEPQMRRFLRAALESHAYRLIEAVTAREGLAQAAGRHPDVILLDLGLPDGDGVDLTRQLREWSRTPVIVISARGREQDKIAALDAGADDYLTKPFAVGELLARLRVALRHASTAGSDTGEPFFRVGDLVVDRSRREVSVGGEQIHLTPTEYRLLAILVQYAGRVVMQRQLLREVWGVHAIAHTHYLRVYMAQLRHKLEPDPARPRWLITEPGVGYRLRDE